MSDHPILLVEDNPDDVVLTTRAFKAADLADDMVVVGDGAAALALLLPDDDPRRVAPHMRLVPTVVLLDLNLPIIDGHGVLRRIRADPRTRFLPVVVLTTSDEERDLAQAYHDGVNSYVCKPIDFAEFVDVVRVLGQYWSRLNRSAPFP